MVSPPTLPPEAKPDKSLLGEATCVGQPASKMPYWTQGSFKQAVLWGHLWTSAESKNKHPQRPYCKRISITRGLKTPALQTVMDAGAAVKMPILDPRIFQKGRLFSGWHSDVCSVKRWVLEDGLLKLAEE